VDNREIYKEKAQAKLDELNARIDLLKSQMKGKAADAKLALNAQVEVLENKREDLQSRMRQIRSSAEGAWDEIAAGLDRAMVEVEHALERAGDALEKSR
jgi:hypothetical protein